MRWHANACPCSLSYSNASVVGSVRKCDFTKLSGARRAVACAGGQRTCFAQLAQGGWVVDKLCNAPDPSAPLECTGTKGEVWACASRPATWAGLPGCAASGQAPPVCSPPHMHS